jgi:hypothetical protein
MSLSQWRLEKILRGELDPKDIVPKEGMRDLERELETMRKHEELLFRERSPHLISTRIMENRRREPISIFPRIFKSKPVFALAGSLVFFCVFLPLVIFESPVHQPKNLVRIKGAQSQFWIYRETKLGSEMLKSGDTVRAGDNLQIQYYSVEGRYGFIYSKDGRGQITRHFPSVGDSATPLHKGEHYLFQSYALDDAPDFEKFFFVSSGSVFELSGILDKMGGAGDTCRIDTSKYKIQVIQLLKKAGKL